MANQKISDLTEKTTVESSDFLAGTQGTGTGDNRKYGLTALTALINSVTSGKGPSISTQLVITPSGSPATLTPDLLDTDANGDIADWKRFTVSENTTFNNPELDGSALPSTLGKVETYTVTFSADATLTFDDEYREESTQAAAIEGVNGEKWVFTVRYDGNTNLHSVFAEKIDE
jgi:hypothetical protein